MILIFSRPIFSQCTCVFSIEKEAIKQATSFVEFKKINICLFFDRSVIFF